MSRNNRNMKAQRAGHEAAFGKRAPVYDRCGECYGYGYNTVDNGEEGYDGNWCAKYTRVKCVSCNGTGRRTEETA